jgi:glutaminase
MVWERVGREHTHAAFASPNPVEDAAGVAPNPFVNAGALVITDRLLTLTGDASGHVRDLLRGESGNPRLEIDPLVVGSEMAHLDRNRSLAHLLASYGVLDNPVEQVLHHYVRQCAIAMSCTDLAHAAGFLARGGVSRDGSQLLTRSDTKRVNALMLTCGAYSTSGEVAYRVGLPLKTGVSGGVLAVAPGKAGMCAWSPGLDRVGNSAGAVAALETFTTLTGYSIF